MVVDSSSKGMFGWWTNIVSTWAYFGWILARTIHAYGKFERSFEGTLHFLLTCIGGSCLFFPMILQINQIRLLHEIPSCYDQYSKLVEESKVKYTKEQPLLSVRPGIVEKIQDDLAGYFVCCLWWMSVAIRILMQIACLANPNMPFMISSVLKPSPRWFYLLARVFCTSLDIYYISSWFAYMFLIGAPSIEVVFTLRAWIHELTLGRPTYLTKDCLRTPEEAIKVFRQVQLLFIEYHNIVSPILPAAEWLFSAWIVFGLCFGLKIRGLYCLIGLTAASVLIFFIGILFTFIGLINQDCKLMLQSWMKQKRSLWFRKTGLQLLSDLLTLALTFSCGGVNFCTSQIRTVKNVNNMKQEAKFYDTVFRDAILVDGSGDPSQIGDLAIVEDKISAVGKIDWSMVDPDKTRILEASGQYLTPGFIDSHTHDDVSVLINPQHTSKIFQGVTTVVTGNCGFSSYPNGDSLELVREHLTTLLGTVHISHFHSDFNSFARSLDGNVGVNVASLVGHGPLRISVMGYEKRAATESEVIQMCALLHGLLEQGSIGMSLGLVYPPSAYADQFELVSLGKVLAQHGKILTAHVRSYEGKLLDSISEFIEILRESKAKGLLSHLQVAGKPYWNTMMDEAIEMITAAKEDGVDIAVDMYPYLAGSSTILQLFPPSAMDGGFDEFVRRLDDPEYISRLKELTETGSEPGWESKVNLIGYENIVVGSAVKESLKDFEGLNIIEGAQLLGVTEFDCLLYLVLEDVGQTNVIMFQQSSEDNDKVFKFPLQMVGSDSIPREGGKPHPRGYGTFPKVVGRMVKDNVLTLAQAVRKTTGLPAERFGITDRGLLKPGMKADLLLFDEDFLDMATFEDPTMPPEGVRGVWVNGVRIVEDGKGNEALPGQVIHAREIIKEDD
ncbi:unnamed protein product [Allacma fusca]|uniref:Amidohydrolase 3 domain-containing protein n=1 Tax=Allacma fusca TaxID=39272 RepID=A0A8J2LED8_9HEXA|nr:unnamed protein product [Allacma fusca]